MPITKTPSKKRPKTERIGYKLPTFLIEEIRNEAIRRRMWPAQVLAEILAERYPRKSKNATAQQQP